MLPNILSILNADLNTQVGSQPRHPKTGTYQGMPHAAAKKGFSQEQSPEHVEDDRDAPNHPAEEIEDEDDEIGQGDRPQKPHTNREHERCPECGGDMRGGECESCGYEEDDDEDDDEVHNFSPRDVAAPKPAAAPAATAAPSPTPEALKARGSSGGNRLGEAAEEGIHAVKAKPSLGRAVGRVAGSLIGSSKNPAGIAGTVADTGRLLKNHPIVGVKAIAKSVVHPIKHSVDKGLPAPEQKTTSFKEASGYTGKFASNAFGGDTPHDQTLRAAGASMAYPPSREHAIGAVDASAEGDSDRAAVLHRKSAKLHLREAEDHLKDGNQDQADAHFEAADLHQRAAGHHMGCQMAHNANPEGHNQYTSAAKAADIASGNAQRMMLGKTGSKKEREAAHMTAAAAHGEAADQAKMAGLHDLSTQHQEARDTHMQHAAYHRSPLTNEVGSTMVVNRKDIIEFIVVNCDCGPTGGPEATRNMLKHRGTEELLENKKNLLDIITANVKAEGSFADVSRGEGREVQVGGEGHGAADEVTYREEEDPDLEEGTVRAKKGRGGDDTTDNRRGPMTRDEWMAAAPPEVREVVRNAEHRDNQENLALQRQITLIANNQPRQKKQLILNQLKGIKTKKGLQTLYALIMPTESMTSNEGSEHIEQVFAGAGAPQTDVTSNQASDDLLIAPTINFAEEHQETRSGRARQTSTTSTGN